MRGGFQTVQRRVASGSEGSAASLAAKGLDLLGLAMLAIANESVDVSIGDAKVRALLIGAGETLGVHPLGCAQAAFDLAPGTHRQRRWPCIRRESGGETAGRAIVWAARLEQTDEL